MNWTITLRKTLTAALASGIAATIAVTATQDDPNYLAALGTAFLVGAVRGSLNAWKHL